jgi:hypothetical protein
MRRPAKLPWPHKRSSRMRSLDLPQRGRRASRPRRSASVMPNSRRIRREIGKNQSPMRTRTRRSQMARSHPRPSGWSRVRRRTAAERAVPARTSRSIGGPEQVARPECLRSRQSQAWPNSRNPSWARSIHSLPDGKSDIISPRRTPSKEENRSNEPEARMVEHKSEMLNRVNGNARPRLHAVSVALVSERRGGFNV